jgi:hypothetical protein
MDGWNAIYSDGEVLSRFDSIGNERGYADIDRDRLVAFEVTDRGKVLIKVCFERPTQKLVYRRRNLCNMCGETSALVVLVGWQEKVDGRSIKVISYIYPDGHIELDGSRNDLELLKQEE